VAKRTAWIGIISLFLLLTPLYASAAEPEVTFDVRERDGYREVMVTTPLVNYLFSEQNGALKSAFLTFAPYGSEAAEAVYGVGTNPDSLIRTPKEDSEFPFTLLRYSENGDGEKQVELDGLYTMGNPVLDESGTLHIEFTGMFSGYEVRKAYSIRPDALYTLGAEIELTPVEGQDPLAVRMLFMKLIPSPIERDPVETGSLGVFGGWGNMDDEIVFFLATAPAQGGVQFFDDTYPTDEEPVTWIDKFGGRYGLDLGRIDKSITYRFTLYSGRRRSIPMEAAGIEVLDQAGLFSKAMVYVIRLLNWLYLKTGNYGWAIIIFTLIMRILLFPLMRKQYHSMARIQQIQPRLKRVQARYKDNKEEMQKKTLRCSDDIGHVAPTVFHDSDDDDGCSGPAKVHGIFLPSHDGIPVVEISFRPVALLSVDNGCSSWAASIRELGNGSCQCRANAPA